MEKLSKLQKAILQELSENAILVYEDKDGKHYKQYDRSKLAKKIALCFNGLGHREFLARPPNEYKTVNIAGTDFRFVKEHRRQLKRNVIDRNFTKAFSRSLRNLERRGFVKLWKQNGKTKGVQ